MISHLFCNSPFLRQKNKFLIMSYPRDLMKHLRNLNKTDANCRITIENNADGIYNIHGETFITQIIVASRLSPEENKFLRCICNGTSNPQLFKEVADDCETNQDNVIYRRYLQQLIPANEQEDDFMCEALFELFGTSSEEIAANATKEANEKIEAQAQTITILQDLLIQNGIPLPE